MRSSATLPDRLNIARRDARYDSALYKILYGGHLVDGVSFSQHAWILEVLSEPKGYSAASTPSCYQRNFHGQVGGFGKGRHKTRRLGTEPNEVLSKTEDSSLL